MLEVPVLIITFNRPEHTLKTLSALKLQKPPIVYVYQDGPRDGNSLDIIKCNEVKDIINNEINWHCNLVKKYSEINRGCRDSIIYAISEVLKVHDSVIVLEDDIITSPAFYTYMVKALEFYKDRKSVYSISGHSHSPEKFVVPKEYDYDVFVSPRLFNWGWGTWRDRWENTDWSMSYYDELIRHPYECQAFNRGGDDMIPMLRNEKEGRSSAWDIQFAFAHFYNHAISIVPCISYTHNIGMDGSGTHCYSIKQDCFNIELLNHNFNPKFIKTLYLDSRIMNLMYSAFAKRKRPFWQKIINFIARKLGKKPPYIIKKKVYA